VTINVQLLDRERERVRGATGADRAGHAGCVNMIRVVPDGLEIRGGAVAGEVDEAVSGNDEIRNQKSELMTKCASFRPSSFEFDSGFWFRHSDFHHHSSVTHPSEAFLTFLMYL
jgi:hypothetical protein